MTTTETVVRARPWRPEGTLMMAGPQDEAIKGPLTWRKTDGTVAVAAGDVPSDLAALLPTMSRMIRLRLRWDDGAGRGTSQARLNGIRYASRTFGFTEPKPLRKRYGASLALLHTQHPELGEMLDKAAGSLWRMLKEYAPAEAADHDRRVREMIHSDWLLDHGEVPWTSGIINRTAELPYHRDAGNVRKSWSGMLTMRQGTEGGNLHLPELDRTLAIDNGTAMFFVGSNTWHGVTPIENIAHNGYRLTIVFYAKSGLRLCGARADEPARAARKATDLMAARVRS
jgi:hypothetical protein